MKHLEYALAQQRGPPSSVLICTMTTDSLCKGENTMSLKISNAPMVYATGGAQEFVLLDVAPLFKYEGGKKTDTQIGQALLVGNPRNFEKFRVKVLHCREKISSQAVRSSSKPIMVRFVNGTVSDYEMDGHMGLSFSADDFEMISESNADNSFDFGGDLDV